jgi:hypothetical protein
MPKLAILPNIAVHVYAQPTSAGGPKQILKTPTCFKSESIDSNPKLQGFTREFHCITSKLVLMASVLETADVVYFVLSLVKFYTLYCLDGLSISLNPLSLRTQGLAVWKPKHLIHW